MKTHRIGYVLCFFSMLIIAVGAGAQGCSEDEPYDEDQEDVEVDDDDDGGDADADSDGDGDGDSDGDSDSDSDSDADSDSDSDADSDSDSDSDSDADSDADSDSDSDGDTDSDSDSDADSDTDADEPWRFAVFGDSRGNDNGVNTAALSSIVNAIVDEDPEFVLFPGDLVNGGNIASELQTWLDTMRPIYDAGIGVYPCRGNHDTNGNPGPWNEIFKDEYALPDNGPSNERNLTYSFSHKNAFFVSLDVYVNWHRVNQEWLDTQFAENTEPHVFVFTHAPAFAAHHSDCLDDYASSRNAFWSSLKDVGARTYFCGHDHFYDHALVDDNDGDPDNNIHQFIVGTAGAPFYNFDGNYNGINSGMTITQQHFSREYGYVIVEVDGLDVELTWMEKSGGSYVPKDTFSYTVE